MIILGVIGKFCAVFVTIPDPIIGGIYVVMFGKYTCTCMCGKLQEIRASNSC